MVRPNALPLLLLLTVAATAVAQDTFSIVAVDPATGEVGSAGASCLAMDVAMISDVHPGIGAINTQALYIPANQEYARGLMEFGLSPAAIIDSLVAHDATSEPEVRQYGIASLANGGTTAAHTGARCIDYKGHRLGATYSIQGNILLGPAILDSMAARYERAQGTLAERLMYAIMGARVTGADTRCTDLGTSSLAAFIRVARPGDDADSLMLDLRVVEPFGIREPLDTLQSLFNRWRLAGFRSDDAGTIAELAVVPNPVTRSTTIVYDLQRPAVVRFTLFDTAGREVGSTELGRLAAGPHELPLDRVGTGPGYLRMSTGTAVRSVRVVIGGE